MIKAITRNTTMTAAAVIVSLAALLFGSNASAAPATQARKIYFKIHSHCHTHKHKHGLTKKTRRVHTHRHCHKHWHPYKNPRHTHKRFKGKFHRNLIHKNHHKGKKRRSKKKRRAKKKSAAKKKTAKK